MSASVHAGIHPPSRHPPGADIPPEQTPPGADTPQSRHPPGGDPPEQTPPWEQTPIPGSRLQHTVNERPVRILLECILVVFRVTIY